MDIINVDIIENPVEVVSVEIETGPVGPRGHAGIGIPTGGNTSQLLAKKTGANYDVYWQNPGEVNADNVIDGVNYHLVSTAEKIVIDNTSGINTGDKSLSDLGGVPTSRKINNHDLASDVTISKSDVGLSTVDNTSDKNKPVSDATQTAMNNLTIAGLKDSGISNPSLNQILIWNGNKWINGQAGSVSAGAGVNLYPTLTPSDLWSPTGYFYFEKSPDLLPELDIPITVNNNKVVFAAYVNDAAINVSTLNSGVWSLYIWGYASDINCNIILDFYKRTSGGVETLLFSITTPQLSTTLTQYLISSIQPEFTLNSTDRLVVKSSGFTTNLTDTIVHGVGGGNTHFTYINTPLVVNHNDLNGLQGGNTTEKYHLTVTELAKVDNIPAGLNTQIQFNDGGTLAGNSNFQFDKTLGVVKIGNGVVPLANNPLAVENSVNGYLQHTIKNNSTGSNSSSDMVATADNGSDSSHYIDMGINGSQYNDPVNYPLEGANDAYVQTASDNLFLIAGGSGKSVTIQAGGTASGNVSATFSQSGVTIPGTLTIGGNTTSGHNTGDQDLSGKVDKVDGKGLSTNDYTTTEKNNLANQSGTNTGDNSPNTLYSGLTQYTDAMADARVSAGITNKVDKITGKGLSSNDFTDNEKTIVDTIQNYALVMAVAMGG